MWRKKKQEGWNKDLFKVWQPDAKQMPGGSAFPRNMLVFKAKKQKKNVSHGW